MLQIISVSPEAIIREVDLGKDLSFKPIEFELAQLQHILEIFYNSELTLLPLQKLQQWQNEQIFVTTINLINQIRSFNANEANPGTVRIAHINQFRNMHNIIIDRLSPSLPILVNPEAKFKQLENKFDKILNEEIETIRSNRNESNEIIAALRKLSAEGGVEKESIYFSSEADDFQSAGNLWLLVTLGVALITATALYFLIKNWDIPYDATNHVIFSSDLIKEITIRLAVLSFGLFFTSWATSNFKANRHNEIVNRHRAISIATFRAFVEGTNNPQVKEAILLQAAQAAFRPQESGYSEGNSIRDPQNTVVEILRKIVPEQKS